MRTPGVGTGYTNQTKLLNLKNQEGAETLVSPLWHSLLYKNSVSSDQHQRLVREKMRKDIKKYLTYHWGHL